MPIPKVRMATWLLKRYPTEIEADLLDFYALDIGDWHQLTYVRGRPVLSSRRLLMLAEKLSERGDSELYRALSGTGWPEITELLARIHDDVSMMRAARFSGSGDEELGTYSLMLPPKRREAAVAESEQDAVETRELLDGLFS